MGQSADITERVAWMLATREFKWYGSEALRHGSFDPASEAI